MFYRPIKRLKSGARGTGHTCSPRKQVLGDGLQVPTHYDRSAGSAIQCDVSSLEKCLSVAKQLLVVLTYLLT